MVSIIYRSVLIMSLVPRRTLCGPVLAARGTFIASARGEIIALSWEGLVIRSAADFVLASMTVAEEWRRCVASASCSGIVTAGAQFSWSPDSLLPRAEAARARELTLVPSALDDVSASPAESRTSSDSIKGSGKANSRNRSAPEPSTSSVSVGGCNDCEALSSPCPAVSTTSTRANRLCSSRDGHGSSSRLKAEGSSGAVVTSVPEPISIPAPACSTKSCRAMSISPGACPPLISHPTIPPVSQPSELPNDIISDISGVSSPSENPPSAKSTPFKPL
ncbi:hypothetical protein OE88DRAFT_851889 [Heliocybe sulcata]|uniref:Uncharacterized protein n=1 Tax=Heliocybe sulcata TaxID=5364 RepID=A0A5C3MTF3_9AGAM|nr:hypothetical protein OE88DRAFT_851889 [Heliocybe sulcata]